MSNRNCRFCNFNLEKVFVDLGAYSCLGSAQRASLSNSAMRVLRRSDISSVQPAQGTIVKPIETESRRMTSVYSGKRSTRGSSIVSRSRRSRSMRCQRSGAISVHTTSGAKLRMVCSTCSRPQSSLVRWPEWKYQFLPPFPTFRNFPFSSATNSLAKNFPITSFPFLFR